MTTTVRTLEDCFEIFRLRWGGVKVAVYEDSMVYQVHPGYGKKASVNANILIRDLGLDERLVAVPGEIVYDDSFSIIEKKCQ